MLPDLTAVQRGGAIAICLLLFVICAYGWLQVWSDMFDDQEPGDKDGRY